ncbi:MAG: crotonase/enoyl-CoA hydratase family protein [Gammaproteobacteria bacterium]|nr:crotonase/enoyl-CoA hydratase family protein [Gammaproteobacteria bacterium]
MSERVLIDINNGIAQVRLNRADKLNALDPDLLHALIEAATSLAGAPGLRAVVLSGEGPSFCAGLDFASFAAMASPGGKMLFDPFGRVPGNPANLVQRAGYDWHKLPVPVIAALRGHVYGGGLQIALGADIRYAAPDTRMSVMEIKWGLIPDMSGSQTLRDLVGLDVAKELTWTGRIVEAKEAKDLGLLTRVCEDPLDDAMETAAAIAGRSPHAIRAGKQLLNQAWHGNDGDGLALEESLQKTLLGSPNQIEAVMANMQKREPKFREV